MITIKNVAGILILLAICSFTLQNCESVSESTHVVSGTIRDSTTSLAIDSAQITWGDTLNLTPIYSDTSGSYLIEVPVRSATIFARKQGYKTGSVVLNNIASDMRNIDFNLVIIP